MEDHETGKRALIAEALIKAGLSPRSSESSEATEAQSAEVESMAPKTQEICSSCQSYDEEGNADCDGDCDEGCEAQNEDDFEYDEEGQLIIGPHGLGCRCEPGDEEEDEADIRQTITELLGQMARQAQGELELTRRSIAAALAEGEQIPVTITFGRDDQFSAQVNLSRNPRLN